MPPASEPYDAPQRSGKSVNFPVAAAVAIYSGVLVAKDANGRANPASDTAGLVVIGRAQFDALNADGAAGDIDVVVAPGVFRYANSAVNAVAQANVGVPLKPIIIQDEKPVDLLALDDPESDHVFKNHEFLYQAYKRAGYGYGLPELAYGSDGSTAA
ncbi:Mu-like prophage major head subunit gpT family protein [Cerasicoccus maritimus]|uniref:Mu-like prophage major head subunit gpT family protein n=1 Tax=Cerasicoccus maritimus TaxID=490089 RepID=UPI0028529A85|nr:Mu-like prophage major head subunit gpT family protein [Cerasicoccus maritimus]